jgi:N-acetylglucosamine-6-phosphate deacetylase
MRVERVIRILISREKTVNLPPRNASRKENLQPCRLAEVSTQDGHTPASEQQAAQAFTILQQTLQAN